MSQDHSIAAQSSFRRPIALAGWAVLALLFALLLWGVATSDRAGWPSFVGDEATYLAAAESLAWDLDLFYDRHDYDRFVEHWKRPPEGLILLSGDHGKQLTFSKPFFYPAYIAPFARLAPQKGPLIANVLLLAVAAVLSARTIRRWVGPAAPLWIAVFIFCSASFAYAYWAHADLFLLSLSAISLSLVFSDPEGQPSKMSLLKWALGGALLAAVGFSRPFYFPLLVPAAFCAPRPRKPRLIAFWAGAVLLLLASIGFHQALGDSWTSYSGERAGFYGRTGYIDVDFPRSEWDRFIHQWGNFAWNPSDLPFDKPFSLRLWFWNALYFLTGRHIGVLAYFLPIVLGLLAGPKDHPRWALAAAIAAAIAGAFLLRPFNFFGGGASIANRYFLPLYPAFWFLAGGPLKLRWLVVVAALSGAFLYPLWSSPGDYLTRPDATYRFVSPLADRALPHETTQSHLKPSGRDDIRMNGLWIKPLDPEIEVREEAFLTLEPNARARLLVAATEPLPAIDLGVIGHADVALVANGRRLDLEPDGDRKRALVKLDSVRARHPMWWTWEPLYLYRLALEFPGSPGVPVPFTLAPARTKNQS